MKMKNPKLNPDDAIVVFADLQTGIVDLPGLTVDPKEMLRFAAGLARLAEILDMPTIALTIPKRGGGTPVVVPEITERRSKFKHVQRTRPDSFENPDIVAAIEESGRKTLIVCGVATEIVVQWLVLSGIANGYKVYVAVDACAGLSPRSEDAALRRFEQAGAVITSVHALSGEFAGDMTKQPGWDVIGVCYQLIAGETPSAQSTK
ncbi:isochorismatase family protein [Ramlibacter sp.]|uniref:isochorismatase family protein n=1 Tax=Ramlibacter sp. TaxID=1917967 RepID=UPI003D0BC958